MGLTNKCLTMNYVYGFNNEGARYLMQEIPSKIKNTTRIQRSIKAVSYFENLDIQTYQKNLRSKFPKNRSKIEIRLVIFLTLLLLPCITGDCCEVGALNNSTG